MCIFQTQSAVLQEDLSVAAILFVATVSSLSRPRGALIVDTLHVLIQPFTVFYQLVFFVRNVTSATCTVEEVIGRRPSASDRSVYKGLKSIGCGYRLPTSVSLLCFLLQLQLGFRQELACFSLHTVDLVAGHV